jgi:hypothetical protein
MIEGADEYGATNIAGKTTNSDPNGSGSDVFDQWALIVLNEILRLLKCDLNTVK